MYIDGKTFHTKSVVCKGLLAHLMTDDQHDIFRVSLNTEGKKYLLHICRMASLIFWAGLILEILVMIVAIIPFIKYSHLTKEADPVFYLNIRIYFLYAALYSVIAVIQSYFFLRFSKIAVRSIETGDSDSYNHSFSLMLKSLRFSFILILINGGLFCFYLFAGI